MKIRTIVYVMVTTAKIHYVSYEYLRVFTGTVNDKLFFYKWLLGYNGNRLISPDRRNQLRNLMY